MNKFHEYFTTTYAGVRSVLGGSFKTIKVLRVLRPILEAKIMRTHSTSPVPLIAADRSPVAGEAVPRPVACLPTMRGRTLLNAILLARIHQKINTLRGVVWSEIDDLNFENAYDAAHAHSYADYFAGSPTMPEIFTWDPLLVKGWKDGFAAAFASQTDVAANTENFHSNGEH